MMGRDSGLLFLGHPVHVSDTPRYSHQQTKPRPTSWTGTINFVVDFQHTTSWFLCGVTDRSNCSYCWLYGR